MSDLCSARRSEQDSWRAHTQGWAKSRRRGSSVPLCGMRQDGQLHAVHSQCVQRGETTRATCTDHIQALNAGGSQFDEANLQSLCGDCNRRKGIALEGGFGR